MLESKKDDQVYKLLNIRLRKLLMRYLFILINFILLKLSWNEGNIFPTTYFAIWIRNRFYDAVESKLRKYQYWWLRDKLQDFIAERDEKLLEKNLFVAIFLLHSYPVHSKKLLFYVHSDLTSQYKVFKMRSSPLGSRKLLEIRRWLNWSKVAHITD